MRGSIGANKRTKFSRSQSPGAMSTTGDPAQRYLPPYQDLYFSGGPYPGYGPTADSTCEEHQVLGENDGLNSEDFPTYSVFPDFIASQKYARLSENNSTGTVSAQANLSDVGLAQEQISVTSSMPIDVEVSRGQPRSSIEVSRGQKKPEIIVYPWMQKVQHASHGRCIASVTRLTSQPPATVMMTAATMMMIVFVMIAYIAFW